MAKQIRPRSSREWQHMESTFDVLHHSGLLHCTLDKFGLQDVDRAVCYMAPIFLRLRPNTSETTSDSDELDKFLRRQYHWAVEGYDSAKWEGCFWRITDIQPPSDQA